MKTPWTLHIWPTARLSLPGTHHAHLRHTYDITCRLDIQQIHRHIYVDSQNQIVVIRNMLVFFGKGWVWPFLAAQSISKFEIETSACMVIPGLGLYTSDDPNDWKSQYICVSAYSFPQTCHCKCCLNVLEKHQPACFSGPGIPRSDSIKALLILSSCLMLPRAVKKAVVVLCLQSQLNFDHKRRTLLFNHICLYSHDFLLLL